MPSVFILLERTSFGCKEGGKMELREQIAEIIDKLAYGETRNPHFIADEIISSSILPNWIVEEKCHHLQHMGDTAASPMEHSKFCECCGTGIITRPALLSDLGREDVKIMPVPQHSQNLLCSIGL